MNKSPNRLNGMFDHEDNSEKFIQFVDDKIQYREHKKGIIFIYSDR